MYDVINRGSRRMDGDGQRLDFSSSVMAKMMSDLSIDVSKGETK